MEETQQTEFEPGVISTLEALSAMAQRLKVTEENILPFAVVILESGEAAYYTIKTKEDESESNAFLEQLILALKEDLAGGTYTHAGLCIDMNATTDDGITLDVFGFYVENHNKSSSFYIQPYSFENGMLETEDLTQTDGPAIPNLF